MRDYPISAENGSIFSDFERMLSDLTCAVDSIAIDPEQAMNTALRFLLGAVKGKFAVLSSFDMERRQVVTQYGCCLPKKFRQRGRLSGRICYEEFVSMGNIRAIFPDLGRTGYIATDPDVIRHHAKAYIGVPIHRENVLVGSLAVYDDHARHFDDTHYQWVLLTAGLIGLISKWKQSMSVSRQLEESQALISQMFQLSPTSIYQVDLRSGRFIKVNAEMCRGTGYSEEELLSMNPMDLLMPGSLELMLDRFAEMSVGNTPSAQVELQVRNKNGQIDWGHFHIRHLYDENNRLWGANVVVHQITERKRAYEELAEYRRRLEALVQERTCELTQANLKLQEEVARRTETAKELHLKSERLKELNTAMRVLLDKRNEDRLRSEENIRVNLVQLIDPFLERLEHSGLSGGQKQLLDVIRMNLNEVAGSPMPELSAKYYIFSPGELQVANLIRQGRTTKDVARLLNVSPRTVESYRNSIRKKLGLKKKKVNLKTYLSSKE